MKKNENPKAVFLKDYKPPAFWVETVDLEFDLEPERTRVRSVMKIRRGPDTPPATALELDGAELELLSVMLDGRKLSPQDYSLSETGLTIAKPPAAFTLEIETRINPAANTSLDGLYMSGGNFCTQCEAEGFRKITFYIDRPDVMARFSAVLRADREAFPVLLSNGNCVARGELPDGRHWVRWEDPFLKPCYLFALVAGKLVAIEDRFTTRSGRKVDLKIYVQPHNRDRCEHAMVSLKKSMRWDEETFGLEYDLDIFMIVAVDDFNMGAMENKGLNIFNSKYVLARPDTATDTDYQNIEGVIGHEYFHNWTGNRVTCRDWFQLSLKEGLTVFRDQEFSADMSARALKRIEDVRMLRTMQFAEDSGPTAHPVRPESYIEINNFYTVTIYEKGAEVIRMQHTLLGKEGFRKGMDLYFKRHDGHAVTIEDFVRAMEDANKADFKQFRLWYSQAGTPELNVTDRYDAKQKTYQLTIRQSCPPTPGQPQKQPMHIPVAAGLLDEQGKALSLHTQDGRMDTPDTVVLNVTLPEQTFTFTDVPSKPVPSLLRGFSAPVKLRHDYSDHDLCLLMAHDSDSFNRWDAGQQYALRVLLRLLAARQSGQPVKVDDQFIAAFETTLRAEDADPGLVAEILTLPAERYIADQVESVDPQNIHQTRETLRGRLAATLGPLLRQRYDELRDDGPFSAEPEAMARRRLRNVCLDYLMQAGKTDAIELCLIQYRAARNMTDKLAAFAALCDVPGELRNDVIQDFHDQYRNDTLVLDKWFGIQALSRLPDTLERVKALQQHPAFSLKNPNKVRALIATFCLANPARFHDPSGKGYELLFDTIVALDRINPQVAARMVPALTRWRKFVSPQRELMRQRLQAILETPDISRDVYELVSKSLSEESKT
ncbi:MAG TPA: aminopeptidase N [Gammaproteobacteria bacterium]|nr:aminopeptidase N [Gammaproteobacteria bacterium]